MNETKLRSIEQLEAFLEATPEIEFTGIIGDGGDERYAHISRVLKRFDYPNRKRHDRGVILAYLKRTSGYSRAQIKRLVARWQECRLSAVPLSKRYGTPAAAFARKYTASSSAPGMRWANCAHHDFPNGKNLLRLVRLWLIISRTGN